MLFQTQLRQLCLLLSLLGLGATSSSAQVSGGATVSGSASLNTACTPTCAVGPLTQAGVAQPASNAFSAPLVSKPLFLFGSHTWNSAQDEDNNTGTTTLDFNAYVAFLKQHGHNATILWHKDLPKFCNWGAGGTWTIADSGTPWARSGTSGGSDGHNKWDLTTFNQPYFDQMRARSLQLYANGIYSIVELFDGLGLSVNRCGTTPPTGDGYPLTGANNINSIDDGYTSGAAGTNSMTMSATNAITAIQDAYVRKMIDTLNDVPNVIWEISEEAPCGSNFWQGHMISLIQSYEATKPFKHQVLFPTFDVNCPSDSTLLNSNADSVAPFGASVATYHVNPIVLCGTGVPACKTVMNDSDHTYFGMWTDTPQVNRNFLWENVMRGSGVLFMDPYVINWTGGSRNLCASPVNGVCSGVDTRYNLFRDNFGYAAALIKKLLNVSAMSASTTLCSTTYCLVNNSATTSEFIVYVPTGGAFTVNLSTQANRNINVQWLNPTTGVYTSGATILGGSATQSFTPPWGSANDAVLYLTDGGVPPAAALFPAMGWTVVPSTTLQAVCTAGSTNCLNVIAAWSGGAADTARNSLYMYGGGHTDSSDNAIYKLDLNNSTMSEFTAPTAAGGSCQSTDTAGTSPNARHTYGGVAYISSRDKLFVFAGSNSCSAGTSSFDTWTYSFTSPAGWTHVGDNLTGGPTCQIHSSQGSCSGPPNNWGVGFGFACDYVPPVVNDPTSDLVYCADELNLYSFNDQTGTWTTISTFNNNDFHQYGVIDIGRRLFFTIGNGNNHSISLAGTGYKSLAMTNCGAMASTGYPGLAYDPVQKLIIGWAGGNNVFQYNPDTDSCTTVNPIGTAPGAQQANGTYGRFKYLPGLGVFALVNDWAQNAWVLRLTSVSAAAAADFTNRSSSSGVILTQSFDDSTGFQNSVNQFASDNGVFPSMDTTILRSGIGSMHIIIPSLQGANAGRFTSGFPSAGLGAGSDFYFQVATRISPEMLSNFQNSATTGWTSWKNHSFFSGNTSCTGMDLTVNINTDGLVPFANTNCGFNGFYTNGGVPPYLIQQGLGPRDFNCPYRGETPIVCFYWPSNTWVTFYYHIRLGTYNAGADTYQGSTVEAWESVNGLPYRKWVSLTWDITGDGGHLWNSLELYPYMTGKDSSKSYPTSHVWWDELIVSKQPIREPQAPPAVP